MYPTEQFKNAVMQWLAVMPLSKKVPSLNPNLAKALECFVYLGFLNYSCFLPESKNMQIEV